MENNPKKIYMAPLEGITGHIFRRVYASIFDGIDKFYAPFLSPGPRELIDKKSIQDILPENNPGVCLVPQILTKSAEDFIGAAKQISEYGYSEVNLNLGCPSGTVVAKGKGSGMLSDTMQLDRFLDKIYSRLDMHISVKTRIGICEADEWPEILKIYNKYPIYELTVHPRYRTQMYKGEVDMDAWNMAVELSINPLVYNGDICTVKDYDDKKEALQYASAIMIGRGILADPRLPEELKLSMGVQRSEAGQRLYHSQNEDYAHALKRFHDELLIQYLENMQEPNNAIPKMKEVWFYLRNKYPGSEKAYKQLRKSKKITEYEAAVRQIYAVLPK